MNATAKKKKIAKTAAELEERFDAGESLLDIADVALTSRKVLVDFPSWMLDDLDEEAERLGIPRQAVIKTMIDQGLKKQKS